MAIEEEEEKEFSRSEDALGELSGLIEDYEECLKILEELQERVKHAEARVKLLGGEMIPEHLARYGLSEVRLADKRKVSVTKDIRVQVKDKAALEDYLISTGAGDLIKFNLSMKKMSDENRKKLFDTMVEMGVEWESENSVHWQTLKKHIKDILGIEMTEEQYKRALRDGSVVTKDVVSQLVDVIHLNITKIK